MSLKESINLENLPKHIAVIMDGNGRWAKEKGKNRIFGHKNGVKSVREVSEACAELGVSFLTLYAFSSENWNRPKLEVAALMELLVRTIGNETKTLMKNNIRLVTIGSIETLPSRAQEQLNKVKLATKDNTRLTLTLALSYGGRTEIVDACKKIATQVKKGEISAEDITELTINNHLYEPNIPDPELMIRTSGEYRLSNFLLWQAAYTELYFTDELWPDFSKESLYKAIHSFQSRERRFGKTSEQLKS
jgi:undecaprenyl diphosphate synthase|tara:strand:+ start:3667 stop:4410 length:744 start_codon:yes stop_codon:yes gene_type:complete